MGVVDTGSRTAVDVRRRAVVAATIGNFVEWYDYIVYGYFAAVLARVFFPVDDRSAGLLAAFAAFGVAYVMRPLGALVLGHLGDRIGRRPMLSVVILVASAASFVIGCLPGYAQWGVAAPALLVLARLVQGFSAGGEYGGATAYMVEFAPPGRRALYGSWQAATQGLALLVGALLAALLTGVLSTASLDAWGWRIPFLIALPLGLIGLYLRLRLSDTPAFENRRQAAESSPVRTTVSEHGRAIVRAVGLVTGWTTGTFLLIFLPSYLPTAFGYTPTEALAGVAVGLLIYTAGSPLAGLWSDRAGRRPVLLVASIGLTVWVVPAFLLMATGSIGNLVLANAGLGITLACYGAAGSTALSEMFPTSVRYTALSIGYSVSVSVFGGFSPLIAVALQTSTGWAIAPSFYVAAAGLISVVAVLGLTETATGELR